MKNKLIKQKNKQGYFFSLDAFIALLIIVGFIFFIKPSSPEFTQSSNLHGDLLSVLSSLKIGEINNSYVKQLISDGNITNLNNSVLDQIGEFYASPGNEEQFLVESILNDLNLSENIGIYFNGMPIVVHGDVNFSGAESVWTSRQIVSGISAGDSAKGFSSRAFLFSKNKVDYFYFGGYVGDGNISVKLDGGIIGANIEAVFSGDFDLYINDVFVQSYSPTTNVPYKIDLANNLSLFSDGENYLDFRSVNNLYLAGGYVRVVYNNSETLSSNVSYNLPGIEGLINLYDGFYVPNYLSNMEIFLHYVSQENIFLNVGNKQVYVGNTNGSEMNITLTNSNLSLILNYSDLSKKTVPLRIGIEDVSYFMNYSKRSDTYSVTDLSGSMAPECSGAGFWCCLFSGDWCTSQGTCNSCGGSFEDPMNLAKQANNAFIDAVLNSSGNNVGLVGYATSAPSSDYHSLSNDSVSLKSEVNSWTASGSTCICCGVNKAVQGFLNESNNSKSQSMIVMSDGGANVQCTEQSTGNAKQDAIQAACDAYDNYNISVYTIGFGADADEVTLQSMASCGSGNYYYGDVNQLIEIYGQIAQDIINASYLEQTVIGENIYTKLYPDSYIHLDYNVSFPFGLLVTSETEVFGNNISLGSFNVPNDTEPYEIRVLSYSGPKWTDSVEVYNSSSMMWESIFNLSVYNLSYVSLGDPYVVNIPLEKIVKGNNSVRVSTALSSLNSSGGSPYNKIIYSLLKEMSAYSPIVSFAEGCKWVVEFEDATNFTFNVPEDYSGSSECYYTSSNLIYNNNDAIDNAIFNLFSEMDLDDDGRLDMKFSANDLSISSIEVSGIPFTWESEVQVRVWR